MRLGISIHNQVHNVVNYISGMKVMDLKVQVIYMNVKCERENGTKHDVTAGYLLVYLFLFPRGPILGLSTSTG